MSNLNLIHKEDERKPMISIEFYQADCEKQILQNRFGDQHRGSDSVTGFMPMSDRVIDLDPTFQRVKRLLLSDSTSYSEHMVNDEYLASLRPMAIGRRMIHTSRGIHALAPAEARPGDKIGFFVGSRYPFVILDVGENTRVIVGQAREFCYARHDF